MPTSEALITLIVLFCAGQLPSEAQSITDVEIYYYAGTYNIILLRTCQMHAVTLSLSCNMIVCLLLCYHGVLIVHVCFSLLFLIVHC